MNSPDELDFESKKYYKQFLEQIFPALEQAFNSTLEDPRTNLIEQGYCKATSFSSWRQILLIDNGANCHEIYNEIQSDLSASISSAITGNYRLALMSIRSFIELSNLFAYYYHHPVEYDWWLEDNHVIKFSELNEKYFKRYKQLEEYKINTNIYREWKKVSKYVHAEYKSYMQSSDTLPFLPQYQKEKLGQWITHFKAANLWINKLFYIIFQKLYFEAYKKIELQDLCQIIKGNLNDINLFSSVQKEWSNQS
ncbi:MAG: hypothetical protein RID09_25920 [Coleofasciculus sp. G1-WW12-02]|uniref:hypothetical protein n=1 Tax=Coleofasciculus sp. G1-WW12-02 TaxID=3068483 RepID=UPI0032F94FAD